LHSDRRRLLLNDEEGLPYPNAKPHLIVPIHFWSNVDLLTRLICATLNAMPKPKVNTSAERDRVKPTLKDEVNGASGTPVELPTAFLSEFRNSLLIWRRGRLGQAVSV
jgi:hypothetical protein